MIIMTIYSFLVIQYKKEFYMPKTFSDKERELIRNTLKEAAADNLKRFGVKKTTVDELVKQVNIPKGTFYLFYASKEELFFDVINDIHNSIQKELICQASLLCNDYTPEKLTELLFCIYKSVENTGLIDLMLNGDMDIIMRKLPDNLVKEHFNEDDFSFESLLSILSVKQKINIKAYSAAFRAVFLSIKYRREIGDAVFDDAIKLLIRGLVVQLND